MKIGSLCSGYGGLDMAVEAFYGAETAFMCDIDKYASIVIKERWGVPNLGDMKQVDWSNVEPVDILTAGYPCQPFSTAGQRKGSADERHLWPYIKEIISHLQPSRVILENVRGHLTLGFKEVLQDLTEIGYDARWAIVRASDVGSPHQRARLFVIAYPNGKGFQGSGNEVNDVANGITADAYSQTGKQLRRANRAISSEGSKIINGTNRQERWDRFEITKREIPTPLDRDKLNPKFVEYMMGLPVGWVTDLNISRSQQLKLLGNGVVPQQAYYAINKLERL
jgi:DNA (cytosine-5)-methyltransferase 1